MQQLIFVKLCNAVQLGHLYEHIFYAHLDTYFRNKKLYQPIDYSINAATNGNGVIYFEIQLYNEMAQKVTYEEVSTIDLDFTDHAIDIAISQILAEKEIPFGWEPYDNLRPLLQTLHEKEWQNIDNVDVYDLKDSVLDEVGFYVVDGPQKKSEKLHIEIAIPHNILAKDPGLTPLFRLVSGCIVNVIANDLSDAAGYFFNTERFAMKRANVTHGIFMTGEHLADVEDDITVCKEIIKDMRSDKAFDRLCDRLTTATYHLDPYQLPDVEKTLRDMSYLVGAAGWKRLATTDNVETILANSVLTLQTTQSKATVSLKDI